MHAPSRTGPCAPSSHRMPTLRGPGFLQRLTERPWWPWARRGLTIAFLLAVGWMLVAQARTVNWPEVADAMRGLPIRAIAWAGCCAAMSYVVYGSFDLIARRCVGHNVPPFSTLAIAMTSYAFTLNLGSLVGGVGVRYRLYARHGLHAGTIGQIVGTSVLTNWSGYFGLAGFVLLQQPSWAEARFIADWPLQAASAALALVPIAYVFLCAQRKGQPLVVRGHAFPLPLWRWASLQIVASTANWAFMATALWLLLERQVPYAMALATVLGGAVAGLVLRVPAGLGVLETVGVLLLTGPLPRDTVLAALLAYRALYYFAPLLIAAAAFGMAELRLRRHGNGEHRKTYSG